MPERPNFEPGYETDPRYFSKATVSTPGPQRRPPDGSEAPTPQQHRFVQGYLGHGNATKAAIDAGYSERSASQIAGSLLRNNKAVRKLVEDARKVLKEKTAYGAEQAMKEAEEAMKFARETENANALVKAVELRSKIMGLLIDKIDVRMLGSFSIKIAGIDDVEQSFQPQAKALEAAIENRTGDQPLQLPVPEKVSDAEIIAPALEEDLIG